MGKHPIIIEIDMDGRCCKCGKRGVCKSGLCISCASKIVLERLKQRPVSGKGAGA